MIYDFLKGTDVHPTVDEIYTELSKLGDQFENGIEENTVTGPKKCTACGVRLGEEYSHCPLCDTKAAEHDIPDAYFRTALFPPHTKEFVHRKKRKINTVVSKERLRAYFNLNP